MKELFYKALDILLMVVLVVLSVPFLIAVAISIFTVGVLLLIGLLMAIPIYYVYDLKETINEKYL